MQIHWLRLAAGALLSLGLQGSFAQSLIIDAAAAEAAQKRGAIIWDVRDSDDYAAGHIPGALKTRVRSLEAELTKLQQAGKR